MDSMPKNLRFERHPTSKKVLQWPSILYATRFGIVDDEHEDHRTQPIPHAYKIAHKIPAASLDLLAQRLMQVGDQLVKIGAYMAVHEHEHILVSLFAEVDGVLCLRFLSLQSPSCTSEKCGAPTQLAMCWL